MIHNTMNINLLRLGKVLQQLMRGAAEKDQVVSLRRPLGRLRPVYSGRSNSCGFYRRTTVLTVRERFETRWSRPASAVRLIATP